MRMQPGYGNFTTVVAFGNRLGRFVHRPHDRFGVMGVAAFQRLVPGGAFEQQLQVSSRLAGGLQN